MKNLRKLQDIKKGIEGVSPDYGWQWGREEESVSEWGSERGVCSCVGHVWVWMRHCHSSWDFWGLVDQAPLTRQPLLPLQCLPGQPVLTQKPCHLEGESGCDLKPSLTSTRGELRLHPGPYRHTIQGQAASLQTHKHWDSSVPGHKLLKCLSWGEDKMVALGRCVLCLLSE